MNATFLLGLAVITAAPPEQISGSVTYREKIALPADAVLTVALDRFDSAGQTNLSETKLHLGGRQVPVSFGLAFVNPRPGRGVTFAVRAEIRSGSRILFQTGPSTAVISNGKRTADLVLVRATTTAPKLLDVKWELFALNGNRLDDALPRPTLELTSRGQRLNGFSGVNRFGGTFELDGPRLQVDPGPMTLMAGPPAAMEVESKFLTALPLVNRAIVFEGELVFSRGERELARFRVAR